MKILVLTKYSSLGASSRLRSLQYISLLADYDINFTVSPFLDDKYLDELYNRNRRKFKYLVKFYIIRLFTLFSVFRYDIVWLEKELFSSFPALFERLFEFFGVKFVVDYDDAVFHNYDLSKSKLVRSLLSKKIDVVMRSANVVVVGNRYLADRAIRAGAKEVVIIPTVIDLERYKIKTSKGDRPPVIGWIGSPSTQKYVVEISVVLEAVCQKFGAKLLLVGANKNVSDYFSNIDIEIVEWAETTEVELINKIDIGIMPLPDGPWEKGKCGYKLIQYMACGKPVVASPVGVNVEIVEKNNCGLLASSSEEWLTALSLLLSSAEKRKEYGASGRDAVEKEYCVQVQVEKLAKLFRNIAKVDNR
jgi:glycosyltransferase involved in cell wall biosynthesis